ncbi:MAG TPA: tetratricopeptide repeat protein [Ktedonobacterales bacterium]|nr:tetratricopeptide repeat protein [Ktedonobacterales bacterium]
MSATQRTAFATLLNHYRITAGLTQEELAERAGVSVRSISDMERGVPHTPRKATIHLLAVALDLSAPDYDAFVAAARGRNAPATAPVLPPSSPPRDSPSHNLPAPPTPLIGRDSELVTACDLLRQAEVRLLTLVGPAGVGKTRLGLAAAAQMLDSFADGAFFVDLASISEHGLISVAIAQTLGISERGAEPLRERLHGYLNARRMLLLLDNFEHLTAAAPSVADMLAACPHLKVLVTSRVAVHVRGEHVLPVSPLTLPDPADLPPVEALACVPAVTLFTTRTRQVRPDFALTAQNAPTVAAICCQLDGLPLAIELAAARMKILPPQMLLTLLEHRLQVLTGGPQDLPLRQQTLRDTLAWSYDLLPESAQALFRRLTIFVGGYTLEAANTIGSALGDELDILDGITTLVDHSLVRQEDERDGTLRFIMLETLREYGREQLALCGETDAIARAHATCYLALAEEAQTRLKGPEQAQWYARLEKEYGNVHAALRWALEHNEIELGLRLGAALWRFWQNCGHLTEGWGWLKAFLALDVNDTQSQSTLAPVRATVLNGAGVLAQRQGDYARAEGLLTQGLEIRRGLGDSWGIASSLNNLGGVAYEQDQYVRAVRLWEESLVLFRELDDLWAAALVHNNLGFVASIRGDYERAMSQFEQSQLLYEANGDIWGIATTLDNQAQALYMQGIVVRAMALSEKSLGLFRELGAKQGVARALITLANISRQQTDYPRATTLITESIAILNDLSDTGFLAAALTTLGTIARDRGDFAGAAERYQESLLLHRTAGRKREVAPCLEGLAAVATAREKPVAAARLCGAAADLRTALGTPLPIVDRAFYEDTLAAIRAALDDASFSAAQQEGAAMELEEVIAATLAVAVPL